MAEAALTTYVYVSIAVFLLCWKPFVFKNRQGWDGMETAVYYTRPIPTLLSNNLYQLHTYTPKHEHSICPSNVFSGIRDYDIPPVSMVETYRSFSFKCHCEKRVTMPPTFKFGSGDLPITEILAFTHFL